MSNTASKFLLSFERGAADWTLLGLSAVDALPAVQWRQQNLNRIDQAGRAQLVARLEKVLYP